MFYSSVAQVDYGDVEIFHYSHSQGRNSVLNGSGRPSLAPGNPRPDPEGQVKYKLGQRGPAVGQAGGRERW